MKMMPAAVQQLIVLFIISGFITELDGKLRCHKNCNGHGYCTDYDNFCVCDEGYSGVDCSMRTCPYDFAYADKAYGIDVAHSLAECSNQGLCNRKTGVCECFTGFGGIACERTLCGGSPECNGHGQCLTMGQIYEQVTATTRGLVTSQYTNWDSNHTTLCSCQMGYSGPACEYQLCPRGDDPYTPFTGYRTIIITTGNVKGLDKLSGNFLFTFNGESFLFPPTSASFTAADCKTKFEALANVKQVTCELLLNNNRFTQYKVQFVKFPIFPVENNIYTHDGNPSLDSFACSTELITGSFFQLECTLSESDTDKTYPEYALCSNRGLCNFNTGVCNCLADLENSNCDTFRGATIITEIALPSDVLQLQVTNPDFEDSLVAIDSNFPGTGAFNTITASDVFNTKFRLDGYGNLRMNYGGLFIGGNGSLNLGGETIRTSGLTVTGGMSVFAGGMTVYETINLVNNGLKVQSGGVGIVGGIDMQNSPFTVTGGGTVHGGIYVNTSGVIVGAGGGSVLLGGMTVTGGTTIAAGGLSIRKRGMTILTDGLFVEGGMTLAGLKGSINSPDGITINTGGFAVTGGVTVFDLGLTTESLTVGSDGLITTITMNNGGLTATGGTTVSANGLEVTGGLTVNNVGVTLPNRLLLTGGLTVYNNGLVVTGGLTVNNQGLYVSGGVTLPVGSLTVSPSSAVTINANGLIVTGGVSVRNVGLRVTSGATIYTAGASVTGGVTVRLDGLFVTGGLTIRSNGLLVTGGVTLPNSGLTSPTTISVINTGLRVTGGVSILSAGVRCTNGITVYTGGIQVTNGLTIFTLGLDSANLVEIQEDGLKITGGLSIQDVGLRVTGGLTLPNTGLTVQADGITVQNVGLRITGGLSALDVGLRITSGVTVYSNSLRVTNGLTVYNTGLTLTGGLTIFSNSLQVTGGLTLQDSHLYVADRVTSANDMTITAGLSVETAGVIVNRYLSIANGGLAVTTGLSIYNLGINLFDLHAQNTGVRIANNGLTIFNDGLDVTSGGLVLNTGGADLPALARFLNNGLDINDGGVTVNNAGFTITGGVTVSGEGIRLRSLTINDDGLYVTGTLTVVNTGFTTDTRIDVPNTLIVTGGITVNNGGAIAPGLTIPRDGLVITGGMTACSSIRITNGITVSSAGLVVTGGMTVPSVDIVTANSPAVRVRLNGVILLGADPLIIASDGIHIQGDELRVNNAVYFENAYTVYSDIRLKDSVELLHDPIEKIKAMHGIYYNFAKYPPKVAEAIDEEEMNDILTYGNFNASHQLIADEDTRHIGLIAQEVQKVLPEVVGQMKNGYLGIQYGALVALLIEAIHVLDKRTARNYCKNMLLSSHQVDVALPCIISSLMEAIQRCRCSNMVHSSFNYDMLSSPAISERIVTLSNRLEQLQQEEKQLVNMLQLVYEKRGIHESIM